jgi:hypothetical protein
MTEMNTTNPNDDPIRKISRMLSSIAEIAEQASLTGSLEKGVDVSLQQYNASLQLLEQWGAIPVGFFPSLAADSSFDAVGVASTQLASYLGIGDGETADQGLHGSRYQHNGPKYQINNEAQFSAEEYTLLRQLLSQYLSKSGSAT